MESLSMQLTPVFDWLLRTTLQAALLFCLIMLVQLILRGRLPIRWHYCLWLLLLIRMATPWLPESKISIFNWVPRSIQEGRIIESLSQPQDTRGMGFYMRGDATESQETEAESAIVRFARILPLLWLLGGVALAVHVGACNFHLWWLVTRERPLTDQKILDLLEDCKAEMGIRNILGLVTTEKVKSAALFGFIRPRLLLPAGMVETLSRQELRYVFLHELGHLRRRDIYVGWLMSLLQILHWFNPLVWLAFYRMQSDRELACDALVLTHARSGESKEYGRTIVSLLERFSRPQRLPSLAGILENKSQLKRRIKMIAKFRKTSRTRGIGAMLLLLALACIVLTNAYVAKADFIFGKPTNLGPNINTGAGEVGPIMSADGLSLYFTSENGYGGISDIWVAHRTKTDDEWGPASNLGPVVNSAACEASPCISTDGLTLFFCDGLWDVAAPQRPGGHGGVDLWCTTRVTQDGEWNPPVNLGPVVNSSYWDGHPAISGDGLSLYFASDRPGGHGRADIYVVTRASVHDEWGPPVNLGPPVNSSSSDNGPGISGDGRILLFTSARPGLLGGYFDIWMAKRRTQNDNWEPPIHLDPPISSINMEGWPRISSDNSVLYFSAVGRPGGFGYYDLWQVKILPVVDLNGDGKVDLKDLRKLAQYWGQYEPSCDIAPLPNGDGIVDEKDLNLLAEHLLKELQPVAHWKLDETQGSVAEDSTGGNDGTLSGNPVWQPHGGQVNGALRLDGLDDYVSTDFSLNPVEGSFSVFAWIKGGARGQVVISQRDTSDGRNTQPGSAWLWADASYGRLITRLMHPPFDPLLSEAVITDDQWHHVGLVYDLEGLRRYLYVDGAQVAGDTDPVGGVGSNGGLYFGAGQMLEPGSLFSGLIDDIGIYDEVLSAEEVAELAQ